MLGCEVDGPNLSCSSSKMNLTTCKTILHNMRKPQDSWCWWEMFFGNVLEEAIAEKGILDTKPEFTDDVSQC